MMCTQLDNEYVQYSCVVLPYKADTNTKVDLLIGRRTQVIGEISYGRATHLSRYYCVVEKRTVVIV
jgi:hypothetical protein